MPSTRRIFQVKAPFKGMMTGNNPSFTPQFFTVAYNVYFDKQGCAVKRPGVRRLAAPIVVNGATGNYVFTASAKTIAKTNAFTNFDSSHKIQVNGHSLRNSTYKWTASGSGTNEYYCELAAGGDPSLEEPNGIKVAGTTATNGTLGSLAAGEWDWGDNDSLGYSTVYIRLSSGNDPDSEIEDYIITTTLNDDTYYLSAATANLLTLKANETLNDETIANPIIYALTPVMGLYEYVKQGTSGSPTTKRIFVIDDMIIAEAAHIDVPTVANAVKTDVTRDKPTDFAVLSDKLYIANGADVLQVYDQSSCADITTPPGSGLTGSFTPSIIETHRWSIWAAGVPGNPSRIYKSVPQDGTDFNTNLTAFHTTDGYALVGASQIDVRPDDGTKITGLAGDHFGQLVIFKEDSIHRILGATKADYCLPPEGVINGIGAYNGTIVKANNDLYFASKKGIHRLSTTQQYGDNAESFVSYPIQEYYNGLDKSYLDKCASCHWPDYNIILWSFRLLGAENNNTILVYNYAVDAWSIWTGIEVTAFALITFQGKKILYLGDSHGRFCKFDFAMRNDYGTTYKAELENIIDLGNAMMKKGYRTFFLDFNPVSGDVEAKFKVDNGSYTTAQSLSDTTIGTQLGQFTLGTDALGGAVRSTVQQCAINLSGRKLHLNLSNDDLNENMEILGYGVEFVPQGYRG